MRADNSLTFLLGLAYAPWLICGLLVVVVIAMSMFTVVIWPNRGDSDHAKRMADAYATLLRAMWPPGKVGEQEPGKRSRRRRKR